MIIVLAPGHFMLSLQGVLPENSVEGTAEHEGGRAKTRVLLFRLVVSGQIELRRIDGWRKIAAVLSPPHRGSGITIIRTALAA
jgi:hypothetical protein